MNSAIALRNSQVAAVLGPDATLTVLLQPAYLYKSEGQPGLDFGTVWLQDVQLVFREASIDGTLPTLPTRIESGHFTAGSERWQDLIPVSTSTTAACQLRLTFDSPQEITIHAKALHITLLDEPLFLELFKP